MGIVFRKDWKKLISSSLFIDQVFLYEIYIYIKEQQAEIHVGLN